MKYINEISTKKSILDYQKYLHTTTAGVTEVPAYAFEGCSSLTFIRKAAHYEHSPRQHTVILNYFQFIKTHTVLLMATQKLSVRKCTGFTSGLVIANRERPKAVINPQPTHFKCRSTVMISPFDAEPS